jgi:deoxyribodipyrimidine photo-lyase
LYYAYFHFWKVVPVLVIPQKANTHLNESSQEMGVFRHQFLLEAALDLKATLAKEKIDLIILKSDENLVSRLKKICTTYNIEHTITSYPRGIYEGDLLGVLSELTAVFTCEDDNLVAMEDLPFTELPKVFTPFRKELEANLEIRDLTQEPLLKKFKDCHHFTDTLELSKHPKHPNSAYPFTGGESAAHERLNYYLWESKAIIEYKETRNELIGENYSSKLSAYLALGNLSPVQVYYAIKKFEAQVEKNESTYWLLFELLWREYFMLVALQAQNKVYALQGIQDKEPRNYTNSPQKFEQWCTGNTEHPFINANMKELITTGYMSNRGRQNVASYLVHHLKIDWRWGAAFFEKHLIDYDISLNWCNWMYVAGVGNNTRNKVFNPSLQQERYDPENAYCKLWNQDC